MNKTIVLSLSLSLFGVALSLSPHFAVADIHDAARSPAASAVVLSIGTKGDELAFDKAKLTAKPNQPIKLTFTNKAAKSSGMQHNWVLIMPGKVDAVGQASMAAGPDKGWVAESPDVIKHTKLLNAGESETLEFNAPAKPGDYPFICSFPGHFQTMKGVLQVK